MAQQTDKPGEPAEPILSQGELFASPEAKAVAGMADVETETDPKPKKEFKPVSFVEAQGIIEQAIKDGRHSPIENWRTVCEMCRQWVDGYWHVTLDGKWICKKCAGVKEKDEPAPRIVKSTYDPFADLPPQGDDGEQTEGTGNEQS